MKWHQVLIGSLCRLGALQLDRVIALVLVLVFIHFVQVKSALFLFCQFKTVFNFIETLKEQYRKRPCISHTFFH